MDASTDRTTGTDDAVFTGHAARGDTCIVVSDGFFMETELGYSRAQAVQDICDGQYAQATAVYCVNIIDETLENVSEEIAQGCLEHIIDSYWPGHAPFIPDLVEEHCGAALADWAAELGGVG